MRLLQRLNARTFFLAYAAFIVYATSVPFHFDRPPTLEDARLIPFWDAGRQRIHSIPDLAQNFVLFLPFGVLGTLSTRWGVLGVTAAGFLLSLTVELLQTMSSVRIAATSDIAANTLGSFVGALAGITYARSLGPQLSEKFMRTAERRPGLLVAGALLLSAAFSALAPFVPTLDVGLLRANLRSFLVDPWGWGGKAMTSLLGDALVFAALAYVGFRELGTVSAGRFRRALVVLGAVSAAAVLLELAQFPLLYHRVSGATALADVLGAIAGVTLALALEEEVSRKTPSAGELTRRRPLLVIGFAVLMPVLRALAPLQFRPWRPVVQALSWRDFLPFWTLFSNLTLATFSNVVEAAATYIPLGYALGGLGKRPSPIFAVSLALAWVLEVAQIGIIGRTFDLTEGLLAASGAFAGLAFFESLERLPAVTRRRASSTPPPVPQTRPSGGDLRSTG